MDRRFKPGEYVRHVGGRYAYKVMRQPLGRNDMYIISDGLMCFSKAAKQLEAAPIANVVYSYVKRHATTRDIKQSHVVDMIKLLGYSYKSHSLDAHFKGGVRAYTFEDKSSIVYMNFNIHLEEVERESC